MLEFPAGCCNEQVFAAQRSSERRRAMVNELAAYAYQFPLSTVPCLDEDVPGDFYLYCYDKLEQIIDRFEDRGIPFEHYANSVLRWHLRSFLRSRKQLDQRWRVALYNLAWDSKETLAGWQRSFDPARAAARANRHRTLVAARPEPPARAPARTPALRLADPAGTFGAAATPATASHRRATPPRRRFRVRRFRLPSDPFQRRMLYALLKTADLLDDRQFDTLVSATGCHPDSLHRLFSRLDRFREPAYRRRQMLRERRNRAFAALHLCVVRAKKEPEPRLRARLLTRAARYRRTVAMAQFELSRVRMAPSNRHIAAALGIPKGTVDTGLHLLRRTNTPD